VDGRSKEGDDAEDARHGKEGSSATEVPAAPTPTPSSFTNTLTSGISSAMRLLLSNGEIPRPSMFSKNHHGLLAPAIVDAFAIDERPHIKYDWTVGKRLKFSCTVYYARQFDNLRRRCGIEDVFVKILSRSANWAAEGGKSKSNFWKTADDRFIIKTLVNAWNIADL
jgi:1-phosphatidylinositol-3-phosphate 5-kinase